MEAQGDMVEQWGESCFAVVSQGWKILNHETALFCHGWMFDHERERRHLETECFAVGIGEEDRQYDRGCLLSKGDAKEEE